MATSSTPPSFRRGFCATRFGPIEIVFEDRLENNPTTPGNWLARSLPIGLALGLQVRKAKPGKADVVNLVANFRILGTFPKASGSPVFKHYQV